MARSSRLAHAVLIALFVGTQVLLQPLSEGFLALFPQSRSHSLLSRHALPVSTATIAPEFTHTNEAWEQLSDEEKEAFKLEKKTRKAQIKYWAKGVELDGDHLTNLDDFYQEGILGTGGKPEGFMMDLIFRSHFGTWPKKTGKFERSYKFTGDYGQPGPDDFEKAWQTFKRNIVEVRHIQGKEDATGLLWLTVTQTPRGLHMYLAGTPPYGERAIAIIQKSNPEEFFAKVDWARLFARLHKPNLWGGTAQTFPYPIKGDMITTELGRSDEEVDVL